MLSLLGEIGGVKLELDVIMYSAGISACEKGGQWPEALSLLREMGDVKLEPDVIIIITMQGPARAGKASV